MLEQRAAEFLLRADDVEGASFTRPTNACRLVCAHLTALYKEAVQQMEGTNLVSFMSEVSVWQGQWACRGCKALSGGG